MAQLIPFAHGVTAGSGMLTSFGSAMRSAHSADRFISKYAAFQPASVPGMSSPIFLNWPLGHAS